MTIAGRIGAAALTLMLATAGAGHASAEKVLMRANDLSFGGKESIDPISPNRFYEVNDIIYSRLVRQDDDGEPAPELAVSWTPNENATEWTLKLQPGVKFHDGSDFDAADVKFTLERIKDPALESPVASVLGMIDHVEVVDPLTAKIVLSSPHAGLPVLLLDYRVRMLPEGAGPTNDKLGIGTGPFKLESYDPEGRTVLVANKDYWEGAPKLDRIEFTAIPDSEARNQAMLAGQLDMSSVTRDQQPVYESNPNFVVQSFPAGDWYGIAFRTDTAPFTDPKVRKAIRVAVNRDEMIKLMVGEGNAAVTCDVPVKSSDPYHAEISCPQDIELAKKLLTEAGFPDGIDIEVNTADLEPGMVQFAEIYQQQVAKAGIRAKVKLAPSDGYWDDVWMKEPASVTSWSERPADQILNEAYRTGSSWNESYFSNPEFDSALDKARSSLDFEEAKKAYGDAQRLLFEVGGTFIPYLQNGSRVMTNKVTGIKPLAEDYIRWHLVDKAE
ncbi:MAG: ABC transporter substrate-binding protein [Rhizobiales bacterium]|nr:ABC transporter substrate-binding protein [Hyphomicrobiales bacterium]